jgi:hypothetical protein
LRAQLTNSPASPLYERGARAAGKRLVMNEETKAAIAFSLGVAVGRAAKAPATNLADETHRAGVSKKLETLEKTVEDLWVLLHNSAQRVRVGKSTDDLWFVEIPLNLFSATVVITFMTYRAPQEEVFKFVASLARQEQLEFLKMTYRQNKEELDAVKKELCNVINVKETTKEQLVAIENKLDLLSASPLISFPVLEFISSFIKLTDINGGTVLFVTE